MMDGLIPEQPSEDRGEPDNAVTLSRSETKPLQLSLCDLTVGQAEDLLRALKYPIRSGSCVDLLEFLVDLSRRWDDCAPKAIDFIRSLETKGLLSEVDLSGCIVLRDGKVNVEECALELFDGVDLPTLCLKESDGGLDVLLEWNDRTDKDYNSAWRQVSNASKAVGVSLGDSFRAERNGDDFEAVMSPSVSLFVSRIARPVERLTVPTCNIWIPRALIIHHASEAILKTMSRELRLPIPDLLSLRNIESLSTMAVCENEALPLEPFRPFLASDSAARIEWRASARIGGKGGYLEAEQLNEKTLDDGWSFRLWPIRSELFPVLLEISGSSHIEGSEVVTASVTRPQLRIELNSFPEDPHGRLLGIVVCRTLNALLENDVLPSQVIEPDDTKLKNDSKTFGQGAMRIEVERESVAVPYLG